MGGLGKEPAVTKAVLAKKGMRNGKMKVEKRFLPSIWQDEFQLPMKFQLALGVLSLVNGQVLV